MARDLQGWLAANSLYPGAADALRAVLAEPTSKLFIVTTKQARFTYALLRAAGVDILEERILSTTDTGDSKGEFLRQIGCRGAPETASFHFVEDKLATLEGISRSTASPVFAVWKLYLVDWGYNTAEERARAASNPRIAVIDKAEFGSLLRQGTSTASKV